MIEEEKKENGKSSPTPTKEVLGKEKGREKPDSPKQLRGGKCRCVFNNKRGKKEVKGVRGEEPVRRGERGGNIRERAE